MALATPVKPQLLPILTDGGAAAESLADSQYCAVISTASVTTGPRTFSKPTAANIIAAGILQNYPAILEQAEIVVIGPTKAKSASTWNAGAELAIADTEGKLNTAASGDYVVAIAREAATAANEYRAVLAVTPYQKN